MSYVAAVCGKGAEVNQVKEQLLQSNPVLEGRIFHIHWDGVTRTVNPVSRALQIPGGWGGKSKEEIQAQTCQANELHPWELLALVLE